jgi:hypothetical protein
MWGKHCPLLTAQQMADVNPDRCEEPVFLKGIEEVRLHKLTDKHQFR